MGFDIEYYKQKLLEKYQSSNASSEKYMKRYYHSIGVYEMDLKLADMHKLAINPEKISLAAILHDYSKFSTMEEYEYIVKKYNLNKDVLKDDIKVLHALLGKYVVMDELGIEDEEVLDAIETHTTGKEDMNTLQEIIFLSDLVELGRTEEYFSFFRKLAYKNYKKAIAYYMKDLMARLAYEGKVIHPYTANAYNFYKKYLLKGEEKYEQVIDCLDHNIVKDVVVYDARKTSPLYDYIIVASTMTARQMEACMNYLKDDFEIRGFELADSWTLIDLNDVIIHVFKEEERERYGIDRLYANLPILNK